MLVQTEDKNYVRDVNNMALTSTNVSELHSYKAQKKRVAETNIMKDDIISLRQELTEIKALLLELVKND